jgi:hypothetical protein
MSLRGSPEDSANRPGVRFRAAEGGQFSPGADSSSRRRLSSPITNEQPRWQGVRPLAGLLLAF